MKEYKMKKSILDEWIEDLENNPQLQGKDWLNFNHRSFCCLGRLANIAVKYGVAKWSEHNDPEIPGIKCLGNSQMLEDEILVWSGLKTSEYDNTDYFQGDLITMNDDEGQTFKQIAQWLRDNVEPIED